MAHTASHRSGYTSIPGSAALRTGRTDGALAALESGEKARISTVTVRGHRLGRVVLTEAFVPVLADVFDRLALDQEPEELCVFMHLWRLSVGEERNWCRVSRAELERRVRMSQLRLGKALAGLVDKGHIALVDRARGGTLYRVFLPGEAPRAASQDEQPLPLQAPSPTTGKRSSPLGEAAGAPPPAASARAPGERASGERGSRKKVSGEEGSMAPVQTVGELVRWFSTRSRRGRRSEEVLEEVLGLIEEGHSLAALQRALERLVTELPRKTPIAEVRRFLDVTP